MTDPDLEFAYQGLAEVVEPGVDHGSVWTYSVQPYGSGATIVIGVDYRTAERIEEAIALSPNLLPIVQFEKWQVLEP
jgi:hypothetical protein